MPLSFPRALRYMERSLSPTSPYIQQTAEEIPREFPSRENPGKPGNKDFSFPYYPVHSALQYIERSLSRFSTFNKQQEEIPREFSSRKDPGKPRNKRFSFPVHSALQYIERSLSLSSTAHYTPLSHSLCRVHPAFSFPFSYNTVRLTFLFSSCYFPVHLPGFLIPILLLLRTLGFLILFLLLASISSRQHPGNPKTNLTSGITPIQKHRCPC